MVKKEVIKVKESVQFKVGEVVFMKGQITEKRTTKKADGTLRIVYKVEFASGEPCYDAILTPVEGIIEEKE